MKVLNCLILSKNVQLMKPCTITAEFYRHLLYNYVTTDFAESSQTSLLSQSVRPHPVQLHPPTILEVIVEEVEPSQTPKVGWFEDKPSTMSSLGVPVMSPDLKRVAKQLIEKHTIENMTLENRLREKESTALKKLYTRIEERKAKVCARILYSST